MERSRLYTSKTRRVESGDWFGFGEADIEINRNLWDKFEEMCPFFINKEVLLEAVPQSMQDYLRRTSRIRSTGRKLLGALSAEKMLVYAPLLKWYIAHETKIKVIHQTIDYKPRKIFIWFVKQVTEARRTGDAEKSKALLDSNRQQLHGDQR